MIWLPFFYKGAKTVFASLVDKVDSSVVSVTEETLLLSFLEKKQILLHHSDVRCSYLAIFFCKRETIFVNSCLLHLTVKPFQN